MITYLTSLEEELVKIFDEYKKQFKLNISIYFNEEWGCFYHHSQHINIDFNYIVKIYKNRKAKERHNYNSFRELAIIVLLHEIGHAIDYKYNNKNYMKRIPKQTQAEINNMLAPTKELIKKYYPLEAVADDFANIEIRRWLK